MRGGRDGQWAGLLKGVVAKGEGDLEVVGRQRRVENGHREAFSPPAAIDRPGGVAIRAATFLPCAS